MMTEITDKTRVGPRSKKELYLCMMENGATAALNAGLFAVLATAAPMSSITYQDHE